MARDGYLLAIDQGTTSSRAILYDAALNPVAKSQREFTQHYPKSGWVEHDAEEIWQSVVQTVRDAVAQSGADAAEIAGIGITNQRETTVLWDKHTGKPVGNALVWQDRRTQDWCRVQRDSGIEKEVREKTGLLLDPYFCAGKIVWMLEQDPALRARCERGEVLFGTIDCYLIWKLTGGKVHATDATNASRTLIYNIAAGDWDSDLLKHFGIPRAMLPRVLDCCADYGKTDPSLFGTAISICGVAGDQQAATIGQACFAPGMVKATYGTGAFMLLNTGDKRITSAAQLADHHCLPVRRRADLCP